MCTGEELGLEIAELAARVDVMTHRLLTCIREFDESRAWYAQGALSCAHWLSWRVGFDLNTAREKVRVARALGGLPVIDKALAEGKLSYAKVRAMTRIATEEMQERLLYLALCSTGAQLERICRGYRTVARQDCPVVAEGRCVSHRMLAGGMVKIELVLAPDEADLVLRAIDAAREPDKTEGKAAEGVSGVSAEEGKAKRAGGGVSAEGPGSGKWPSRADGVVGLAESFLGNVRAARSHGGDRYQVLVHVDQDPLAPDGTVAATLEDGTQIAAETFRRIACDCGLVAVTGGEGTDRALDLGRRTRSISPALRRALAVRAHGCQFPGCTHDRFIDAHHVQHWVNGGETNLGNLVNLCGRHHVLVHEGGWRVELDEQGDWRFIAPRNERAEAAEASRAARQRILQEWADKEVATLGPDTNEPLWDGLRPDYDVAVTGLFG